MLAACSNANDSTTPLGTAGGPQTPVATAAPGYYATLGNAIIDDAGQVALLRGINWTGMEGANYAPGGLNERAMPVLLDQLAQLGFNIVRIPFSTAMLDPGQTPNNIDFAKNPDLENISPLEVLDKVIEAVGARGMKVILARERLAANDGGRGLWYNLDYPEERWIADWEMLAERYGAGNTVIGVELHHAPGNNATWGDDDPDTDWKAAAERAGNAVLAKNSQLLILVQGIETYDSFEYWPGANLAGARTAPVTLDVPGRLVYAANMYSPTLDDTRPWFLDPAYPDNLAAVWDGAWGYLAAEGIAPVMLSEVGSQTLTLDERQWTRTWSAYVQDKRSSFAWSAFNPNPRASIGVMQANWETIEADAMAVLTPLLP
ncbi:MAG: glycoside hydrolase family 5 protein [Polyangiales bacterium]